MPNIASLLVFPFLLIFFRVGACFMVFPGFSDISVNVRTRILLAFVVSLAMFPVLEPSLPSLPNSSSLLLMYVLVEVAIGITLAIGARLFMTTMHVAGELVGFSSGLHASTLFDPRSGGNTSAPGLFLGMIASVLIFSMNLHHFIIQGVFDSYQTFPAGELPPVGDVTKALIVVVKDIFYIGIKIAAPVMAVGFLTYVAFGVFNRLIPQLQIFFVAMPLMIIVGLLMLATSLGAMITLFMDEMAIHAILFSQE